MRSPHLEPKQIKPTSIAKTYTAAAQDSTRTSADPEIKGTKIHKPYLMRLGLQSSEKRRSLSRPATRKSSEIYSKAKQVDNQYGSVLNRFVTGNSRAYPNSLRKSNLKTGFRKGTAAENMDSRRVRFQHDVRES